MNKEMYVKPEISIQEVCLEPFMTISGTGPGSMPWGAPEMPDNDFEEDELVEKQVNVGNLNSIWDNNEKQYTVDAW